MARRRPAPFPAQQPGPSAEPLPIPRLDPSLLSIGNAAASSFKPIPIDPALFEIESVVNDVRKGKIKLTDDVRNASTDAVGLTYLVADPTDRAISGGAISADVLGLEDEIDPALREIVNSLTNAQQSSISLGPGLTHAQAAAAIETHLAETAEQGEPFHPTLEDFAQADFGALFPSNFTHDPSSSNFLLPAPPASSDADPLNVPRTPQSLGNAIGSIKGTPAPKRSRGRPKGSKNKPKPGPPPKKRTPPPSRPKGRPPKVRNPDDQAEFEKRKEEKALGIKRPKGRPRKFPGYLVREMRLKQNREEFQRVIMRLEIANKRESGDSSRLPLDQEDRGQDDGGQREGGDRGMEVDEADFEGWDVQDGQSLLDVVGAAQRHLRAMGMGMGMEEQEMGEGDGGDAGDAGPSGLGKGDEGMNEVFGLDQGVVDP